MERLNLFNLGDVVTFKTEDRQRNAQKYVIVDKDENNNNLIISHKGSRQVIFPFEKYSRRRNLRLLKKKKSLSGIL